jgi:hypothetical protein
MKRIAIFLLTLLIALSSISCLPASSLLLLAMANNVSVSADSSSNEYLKNCDEIGEYIDEDAYDELIYLFDIYSIEVYFNEKPYVYADYDPTFYYYPPFTTIEDEDVSAAIHYIYDAVTALGSDDLTVMLVRNSIDALYCWKKVMVESISQTFYLPPTTLNHSILISYNLNSEENDLTANIINRIAFDAAGSDGISANQDAFNLSAQNGFINYNDLNSRKADNYLNILSKNGIININKVNAECLSAGFLSQESLKNFQRDFSEYAYELASSDSQLWALYSFCKPIRDKADWTLEQMAILNPMWTKEFFLNLSKPSSASSLIEMNNDFSVPTYFYPNAYAGFYENTEGTMTAALEITSLDDKTGAIEAVFSFGPADEVSEGKTGSYRMNGNVNFKTAEITLYGTDWISEQPEGYNMLNIHGSMFSSKLVGNFERDYSAEIVLDMVE